MVSDRVIEVSLVFTVVSLLSDVLKLGCGISLLLSSAAIF